MTFSSAFSYELGWVGYSIYGSDFDVADRVMANDWEMRTGISTLSWDSPDASSLAARRNAQRSAGERARRRTGLRRSDRTNENAELERCSGVAPTLAARPPPPGDLVYMNVKRCDSVVWIVVDADLKFQSYFWLGGRPGKRLPSLDDYQNAKQARVNADGVKAERVNTKKIPRKAFTPLPDISAIAVRLFGERKPS